MPSDERMNSIIEQLAPQRDLFRSAVAEASEQLRAVLSGYRNSTDNDAERAAAELGRFARGRIDPALFALVFGEQKTIEPSAIEWIDRAESVLHEIASTTHLLQQVKVNAGGSLRLAVDRALARIGRAFGAVRVAEYARAGYPIRQEAKFLDVFPHALWNRAERRVALPLIVEVDGRDLNVGGLEEFLDGTQTIVLVVNGPAAPAPLVRLITPGVLVVQTATAAELSLLTTASGPAIGALVPETCAQFVHERGKIIVNSKGTSERLVPLGRAGIFQQREELAQLEALARKPLPEPESSEPKAEAKPEDVLAAWLLREADMSARG